MAEPRELSLPISHLRQVGIDRGPAAPVTSVARAALPVTKRRWFRVALWIHRWTGLVAAPFFLILCLTGSVLIFHEEVDHLLGDRANLAGPAPKVGGWQAFVDTALRKDGAVGKDSAIGKDERPVSVFFDPKTPQALYVATAPKGHVELDDAHYKLIDMATGKPAKMSDPDATLTGFLLKLHAKWFLGTPGELFGGIIALLTFASLIAGVVVYAPYVRNMLFGVIRRGRGQRIIQLDLHNFIGIVMLGWGIVVAVTGIILALSTVLLANYQAGELKAMAAEARSAPGSTLVSIDNVIAATKVVAPERRARFIVFPDTDFSGPSTFTVFLYGTKPYNERLFDVAVVEAGTGRVLAVRPLPLHLAALVLSGPLHFGNYGGMALKILWFVSAWATMYITGNGFWLWFRKRRSKVSTAKLAIP